MDKLVIKSHRRRVLKEGSNLSKISSNVQNEPEGRDPGAEETDAESGHQPECEPMTEFRATGLGGGVGPGGGSRRRAGDGEGEGGLVASRRRACGAWGQTRGEGALSKYS